MVCEGETEQDYADEETVEETVFFVEADAAAFAFFVDVSEGDDAWRWEGVLVGGF